MTRVSEGKFRVANKSRKSIP